MLHRRYPAAFILTLLLSACSSASGSTAPAQPSATPRATAQTARLLPPIRGAYAALGASETYGDGAQPHTKGYAYLVARSLHAHPFVDVGIPGTTLSAGYQAELTGALAIRPQLCTVFFGFNDARLGVSRSAFLSDLNDLVVTLRRARCHVLVIDLPDLSLLPAVRNSGIPGIQHLVLSWNKGMKTVARKDGASFLDLGKYSQELAQHPEYISSDGLHPSNAGHRRLAAVVVSAVRRLKLISTR
jgi:lysophospholipase L1-like esterase